MEKPLNELDIAMNTIKENLLKDLINSLTKTNDESNYTIDSKELYL